jgi:hypothetical protein
VRAMFSDIVFCSAALLLVVRFSVPAFGGHTGTGLQRAALSRPQPNAFYPVSFG